ncbi:exosortase/archaeosortase family protein [Cnuella takakiae]|uniref:Exosortase/archaeosortase family protein n=1 Tax=Cnuella takakiae TaxID=1302690 RepID=A0A1M5E2T4_9BACT|nr:exosortase/archaeosortase family protein [Cnuella takakiae]OLY93797.1 hypothetical protein BUE76_19335 [Cnuella takakiae]SHF73490.1 exosortase/archaeosortase family protein [Cnuella takakiae]
MYLKKLSTALDLSFTFKFLGLFAVLYYFHLFYWGLTTPDGTVYSSFLDLHFNYINWWTSLIVHTAKAASATLGLVTEIKGLKTLQTNNGSWVNVNFACLGFGVLSFWFAFVWASRVGLRKMMMWTLAGLIGFFVLNSIRICVLLYALHQNWQVNRFMDHHETFNVITYLFIFLLIYLFSRVPDQKVKSV